MYQKISGKNGDVGLAQIKSGFAWHLNGGGELNKSDNELFASEQEAARTAKVGLWADVKPIEPWVYRKGMNLPPPQLPRPQQFIPPAPPLNPADMVVGIVSSQLYYALHCDEVKFNPNVLQRMFNSEQLAKDAGYSPAAKCTKAKPRQQAAAPSLRSASAIRIVEVTSDVEAFVGKLVTLRGDTAISTRFVGPFNGESASVYAFSINDGSDSILMYTSKNSGAARLRSMLLRRTDDVVAESKVRVRILGGGGGGYVYGELVDFVLYGLQ